MLDGPGTRLVLVRAKFPNLFRSTVPPLQTRPNMTQRHTCLMLDTLTEKVSRTWLK